MAVMVTDSATELLNGLTASVCVCVCVYSYSIKPISNIYIRVLQTLPKATVQWAAADVFINIKMWSIACLAKNYFFPFVMMFYSLQCHAVHFSFRFSSLCNMTEFVMMEKL